MTRPLLMASRLSSSLPPARHPAPGSPCLAREHKYHHSRHHRTKYALPPPKYGVFPPPVFLGNLRLLQRMMRGGLVRVLTPLPRLSVAPHLSPFPLHLPASPLHLSPSSRHPSTSPPLASPGPAFSTLGEIGHPVIDPAVLTTLTTAAMKEHLAKHGVLNPALPAGYQLEVAEVLALAESLAAVVTRAAAAGEWGELEGLVEDSCLRRLTSAMEAMTEEQRNLVTLNPDDVLMSFVANGKEGEGGNNLNIVVFSFPKLQELKEHVVKMNDLKPDPLGLKSVDEAMAAMKDLKVNMEALSKERVDLFNSSEIMITNLRLERGSPAASWTVTMVGQTCLKETGHQYTRWASSTFHPPHFLLPNHIPTS